MRGEDAPLVRAVAAAPADPERAREARALLRGRFAPAPARGLKGLLASASLDGVDPERSGGTGAPSTCDSADRHQRPLRGPQGHEGVRPRDPAKAAVPEARLVEVADAFGPRVVGVDPPVAEAWGRTSATRSVPVVGALLAATAARMKGNS